MTTNQTIDGVPRELATLLLRSLNGGSDTLTGTEHAQAYKELRALLDAPAVESPIPQHFVEACDKFDWTPEEALRFYADGKHFDTDRGRTRIHCTGAIASHALKGMGEGYAAMKGIEPAAQPKGEPVAEVYRGPVSGINRIRWINSRTQPVGAKLYAEQPAPVAVLPSRDDSLGTAERDFYANGYRHGWNACIDEVTRLNSKSP